MLRLRARRSLGSKVCYTCSASTASSLLVPSSSVTRAETPWWGYIGGILGAFAVVVVIIFAQQLGSGTVSGVAVTAQLITAICLDSFGIVGFVRRQVLWPRIAGAVLMIVGVALVSVYRGNPVS